MAMVLPNFLGRMQATGNFKTLFTMADAIGETQSLVLVARADYIEENRDVLVDLMEDWITGVRWFLDPANLDDAHQVVARVTEAPADRFRFAFTGKRLPAQRQRHAQSGELPKNHRFRSRRGRHSRATFC